ncbi:hypothetical protein [Nocardia sp. NPDC058666]|uniref:hypothetical protein n=1 Tax=unclassified Nocardia TaxID=2637762 RepID=UPI003655C1D9
MGLDQFICAEHGWLSHVAVHEAAHAVIAHARGIEFVDITIAHPAALAELLGGGPAVAGGLRLTTAEHRSWMPRQPDSALDTLMAGHVAEKLAFQHYLPNGHSGDLKILAMGMGWSPDTDPAIIDVALQNSRGRLEPEIVQRYAAIKRIVDEIGRRLEVDQYGSDTGFNADLRLHAEEVIALIENP